VLCRLGGFFLFCSIFLANPFTTLANPPLEGARALRPLARFAPEHFDVVDIPYGWSTQPLRRRVRPQPGERRRLRRARDAI
jgi:hypothetical protein